MHHECLQNLYTSPNIIRVIKSRRIRWVGHGARTGEMRNAYNTVVGKPKGRRTLGRPTRKWKDIKINLR
jgi:hypothetical protein